jgi:hypothetical protein
MNLEVPVSLAQCRKLFGRGRTWMSGIKNAMGVKGNFVFISAVSKFVQDNPTWTEADVYRREKREWRVQVRAGSGLATHVVRASQVKQTGAKTVCAGRVEILFAGEVVNLDKKC